MTDPWHHQNGLLRPGREHPHVVEPTLQPCRALGLGSASPVELGMIGIIVGGSEKIDNVLGDIARP